MRNDRPGRAASRRVGLLLAFLLGAGMLSSSAAAEAPPRGDESTYGYALAHELMSPFCPGRTLAACPSEQATELRQWILLQEAAGATREDVIAVLESRYGDVIKSSPEAEGWGLAAWLLPGGALIVGAILAALGLRRMVASPRKPAAPVETARERNTKTHAGAPADDAELERLVDAELAAGDR